MSDEERNEVLAAIQKLDDACREVYQHKSGSLSCGGEFEEVKTLALCCGLVTLKHLGRYKKD